MRVSRGKFAAAAGAFATIGIARFPAGAAEFSYKLALNFPLLYPPARHAANAAEQITRESGGRLEIKVFPGGQLGGQLDILSQLRSGAVELSLPPDVDTANLAPVAGMTALPFIVSSAADGLKITSGPFGGYVRDALARIGLHALPNSWRGGFLEVQTSVRPVSVPEDVRGLKLRTTNSPLEIALFKALGATPTIVTANEIYAALQTHLVDGATVPLATYSAFKFFEVTKYFSFTNHSWIGYMLLANADAWQRLPKDLQDLVAKHFEAERTLSNEEMSTADGTIETALQARGILFNPVVAPAFRKAVRDSGLYAQWKATYPPEAWSLLEASVGTLG